MTSQKMDELKCKGWTVDYSISSAAFFPTYPDGISHHSGYVDNRLAWDEVARLDEIETRLKRTQDHD